MSESLQQKWLLAYCHVRIIGDRSIQVKDFGHIQLIGQKEMKKVQKNFKTRIDQGNLSSLKLASVVANNHYTCFGPGTVNIIRQLIWLEEMKWGDERITNDGSRQWRWCKYNSGKAD